MGNDAPVIEVEAPVPEVDGVVPIQLRLSDTSGAALSIRVEFDIQGDALGFQPARLAGLDAKDPTPNPALSGIVAPEDGTELVFFWDTDSDLADLERDVRLRFTPIDPVVEGAAKETGTCRLDNNAAPIVQIEDGFFLLNPDERSGIPVVYRVRDEEEGPVPLLVQGRRDGEDFPALPAGGPDAIDALVRASERSRELNVCSPYPRFARGHVVPIDETHARLPELSASESWI